MYELNKDNDGSDEARRKGIELGDATMRVGQAVAKGARCAHVQDGPVLKPIGERRAQLVVEDKVPHGLQDKSRRKEYKNDELLHIRVVKKMAQRDPGKRAPSGRPRPFCFIQLKHNNDKAKACESRRMSVVIRNPTSARSIVASLSTRSRIQSLH